MLKVLISGCNGHMGKVVAEICREAEDVEITAGFDLLGQKNEDFPVFSSPVEYSGQGDVLIDFSSPGALSSLLEFGLARHIPLVRLPPDILPNSWSGSGPSLRRFPFSAPEICPLGSTCWWGW